MNTFWAQQRLPSREAEKLLGEITPSKMKKPQLISLFISRKGCEPANKKFEKGKTKEGMAALLEEVKAAVKEVTNSIVPDTPAKGTDLVQQQSTGATCTTMTTITTA